jgi:hypothetical protein
MVTVTNFHEVERKDKKGSFISLELPGGVELIQSSISGKFYATVRKCRISSTLDSDTAKMMVGQKLEGEIVRVSADPYEFISPTTGEVVTLQHTYAYQPPGSLQLTGHTPVGELVS